MGEIIALPVRRQDVQVVEIVEDTKANLDVSRAILAVQAGLNVKTNELLRTLRRLWLTVIALVVVVAGVTTGAVYSLIVQHDNQTVLTHVAHTDRLVSVEAATTATSVPPLPVVVPQPVPMPVTSPVTAVVRSTPVVSPVVSRTVHVTALPAPVFAPPAPVFHPAASALPPVAVKTASPVSNGNGQGNGKGGGHVPPGRVGKG
jgi:hypothetical protein